MDRQLPLAVLLVLAVALTGCVGDDDAAEMDAADAGADLNTTTTDTDVDAADTANASAPPTVELQVSTTGLYPLNPGYRLSTSSIAADAIVNLTFTNAEENRVSPHDWVLEGVDGARTDVIGPGESTTVTFTAPTEPGDYTYFCSVGDHRDRGMEGTLTVT